MRRAMPGIAVLTAGLMLAAGLAGCTASGAAPGGTATAGDGIGPITFAIGKDNSGWLQDIISGWNQGHPDQKVTLLLLPEAANDQLAQLVANLQAKSDLYDVIDMDVIWTAEFASNGWIIPLPQGQFPLGDFLKPAVDTAMYQGRLYAVPDYSNADLLYYRKDILAKAGKQPPRTWAQLQQLADDRGAEVRALRVRRHVRPVRGAHRQLRVGRAIGRGVDPVPRGHQGHRELGPGAAGAGVPRGRVPAGLDPAGRADLRGGVGAGRVRGRPVPVPGQLARRVRGAVRPGPRNQVYGKFGVTALPGLDGTGSSSLGGANLAISSYSQHQRTALDFIKYLTDLPNERQMLEQGSFPPVWTRLYTDKSLIRSHPYLPVLEQAINSARPRPAITNYDQASLAISSAVYQALTQQKKPEQALAEMAGQLTQIIRDG